MKLSDLQFDYPENLVATKPTRPSRVLWVEKGEPQEISVAELLEKIPAGDVLVLNNTKVLKRRVFAGDLEILFLGRLSGHEERWEVLFPSRKYAIGEKIELPLGVQMTLVQKGRPQVVEVSEALNEAYFEKVAELPLPPYIQKARGERHTVEADESWYQTAWAKEPGSFAAPTASLHFSSKDLEQLAKKGVKIVELTLHVGLGTFLPVTAEDLNDHSMHSEWVEIPFEVWAEIQSAKKAGQKIWALGTTASRALESAGKNLFPSREKSLQGWTSILIQPGFEWTVVDRLLTNFHQPESTLLALVAGFSDLNTVKSAYQYAISRSFKLFSYGDLSVWIK
ncbi:MAG: tRNA preQ1(34) S-adenosylmethionine ribosyltransferase-isomerase QueA [Pseudobdellovibrionaceae bacterium]